MNKRYIIGFSVVCLVIMMATAFATADSNEKTVRTLINQRTETLRSYYDGKLEKSEAESIIREMESGNLLEQDLDNIEAYFQTDIDRVKDYSISAVNITYADGDMICAEVFMEWEVESVDSENSSFLCQYSAICQKEKNIYKLVQFF